MSDLCEKKSIKFFIHIFEMAFISNKRLKLMIISLQDDLFFVDSLDIPSEDPKYIEDLIQKRRWGPSVLFIHE